MKRIRHFALLAFTISAATSASAQELTLASTLRSADISTSETAMGRNVLCAEGTQATIAEIQAWVQRCNYNVCPHECNGGFYVRARQWSNGRWNVICECDR